MPINISIDGAPTKDSYLKVRMTIVTSLLNEFINGTDIAKLNFLMSIDFWDWEIESLLESMEGASKTLQVTGTERIIPVKAKGAGKTIDEVKAEMLDTWNVCISEINELYETFDEYDLDGLGLFEAIDFDVYYK